MFVKEVSTCPELVRVLHYNEQKAEVHHLRES